MTEVSRTEVKKVHGPYDAKNVPKEVLALLFHKEKGLGISVNIGRDGKPTGDYHGVWTHKRLTKEEELVKLMQDEDLVLSVQYFLAWYYNSVTSNCGYKQLYSINPSIRLFLHKTPKKKEEEIKNYENIKYGSTSIPLWSGLLMKPEFAKEREAIIGVVRDLFMGYFKESMHFRDFPMLLSGRVSHEYLRGGRTEDAYMYCDSTTLFANEILDNGALIILPPMWNNNYPTRMPSGELIQMYMWIPDIKHRNLAFTPHKELLQSTYRILGKSLPTEESYVEECHKNSEYPPDKGKYKSGLESVLETWKTYLSQQVVDEKPQPPAEQQEEEDVKEVKVNS